MPAALFPHSVPCLLSLSLHPKLVSKMTPMPAATPGEGLSSPLSLSLSLGESSRSECAGTALASPESLVTLYYGDRRRESMKSAESLHKRISDDGIPYQSESSSTPIVELILPPMMPFPHFLKESPFKKSPQQECIFQPYDSTGVQMLTMAKSAALVPLLASS